MQILYGIVVFYFEFPKDKFTGSDSGFIFNTGGISQLYGLKITTSNLGNMNAVTVIGMNDRVEIKETIIEAHSAGYTSSIDLGYDGPTPNDINDTDSGPNGLQNYPEITFAGEVEVGGLHINRIEGTLNSTNGVNFRIDVFARTPLGETIYLGSQIVSTVGNNATFSMDPTVTIVHGTEIIATATNLTTLSTSEFGMGWFMDNLDATTNFAGLGAAGTVVSSTPNPILVGTTNEPYSTISFDIYKVIDGQGNVSLVENVYSQNNPDFIINSNGEWSYNTSNLGPGIYRIDIGGQQPKYIVVAGAVDSNTLNLGITTTYAAGTPNAVGNMDDVLSNPAVIEYTDSNGMSTLALVGDFNSINTNIDKIFLPNNLDWASEMLYDLPGVEGSYTVTLHAFSGNTTTYDVATQANAVIVDYTVPVFTFDNITTTNTSPELSGTFSDNSGLYTIIVIVGQDLSTLFNGPIDLTPTSTGGGYAYNFDFANAMLGMNNSSIVTFNVSSGQNGTWSIPAGQITNMSPGTYDVLVLGWDIAGIMNGYDMTPADLIIQGGLTIEDPVIIPEAPNVNIETTSELLSIQPTLPSNILPANPVDNSSELIDKGNIIYSTELHSIGNTSSSSTVTNNTSTNHTPNTTSVNNTTTTSYTPSQNQITAPTSNSSSDASTNEATSTDESINSSTGSENGNISSGNKDSANSAEQGFNLPSNVFGQMYNQMTVVVKNDPVGAALTAGIGSIASGVVYATVGTGASGLITSAGSAAVNASIQSAAAASGQSIMGSLSNTGMRSMRFGRFGGISTSGAASHNKKQYNKGENIELADRCKCELCRGVRKKFIKSALKSTG